MNHSKYTSTAIVIMMIFSSIFVIIPSNVRGGYTYIGDITETDGGGNDRWDEVYAIDLNYDGTKIVITCKGGDYAGFTWPNINMLMYNTGDLENYLYKKASVGTGYGETCDVSWNRGSSEIVTGDNFDTGGQWTCRIRGWNNIFGVYDMWDAPFDPSYPSYDTYSLDWNPILNDCRVALSGDNHVYVYDFQTNTMVYSDSGTNWWECYSISWSNDGTKLAYSLGDTNQIRIKDFSGGGVTTIAATKAKDISWNDDGTLLAATSASSLKIWNTSTWAVEKTYAGNYDDVEFNPQYDLLTAGSGSSIYTWDTSNWNLMDTLTGHSATWIRGQRISWSGDGSMLAYTGSSYNVKLYSFSVEPPSEPLNPVANTGDGYVNITWDAPADSGDSSITNYNIYKGLSPGGAYHDTIGPQLYYNDTSVTNGQIYYYQISAVNGIGEGPKSSEVSGTPIGPDTTAPSTTLTIVPNYNNTGTWDVNFVWNDPAVFGDITSGVYAVDIFVETPVTPGVFNHWSGQTDPGITGTMTYAPSDGEGTYSFYALSRDYAGNNESSVKPLVSEDSISYDVGMPSITSTTPTDGAPNIAITTGTYIVEFSEDMDNSNTNVVTNLPGASPSWFDSDTLEIDYTLLNEETTYSIDFTGQGHTDLAENSLSGTMIFDFTTGDFSTPSIISTSPSDGTNNVAVSAGTYILEFNEPMDISNIGFTSNLPGTLGIGVWDGTGMWFNISYSALSEGTTYNVDLSGHGHTDDSANSNALSGNMAFSFTTGDFTNPIADAGNSQNVNLGMEVMFDGSASTDNIGIISYTWNFTDGGPQTLSGQFENYTFNNLGNFLITLNVTDAAGNWDTDTIWINVSDMSSPIAEAGPNQIADEGTTVMLDATGSLDNVAITSYTWTFNDGTPQTLFDQFANYTFNNVGNYLVTLNTSDDAGNWDTDNVWINITDITAPIADAGQSLTMPEGIIIMLNGSNSSDNVIITNYTWTFMDGGLQTLYGEFVNYTFINIGNFEVTLNVTDGVGLWQTDILWVNTTDATSPIADAGNNQTIYSGDAANFAATSSIDNVGIVNYSWFFEYNGTQVQLFGETTNYVFWTPGNYTVTLNVTDSEGNWDANSIIITVLDLALDSDGDGIPDVTDDDDDNDGVLDINDAFPLDPNEDTDTDGDGIGNNADTDDDGDGVDDVDDPAPLDPTITSVSDDAVAPIADAGIDQNISAGTEVTFNGTGSSDNVGIDNYTWSFIYNNTAITLYGPSPQFTFWASGNYTITLTIRDVAGNMANDTVLVSVSESVVPVDIDDGTTETEGGMGDYFWIIVILIIVMVASIAGFAAYNSYQKKMEVPCPKCGNITEPDWAICPVCNTQLKEVPETLE